MSKLEWIQDFLSQKNIAVVGVSKSNSKFGTVVYKDLKKKEYNVLGVNPNLKFIDGDKCFKDISDLPDEIENVVFVLPPDKGFDLIKQCSEKGIKKIWFQQGAGTIDLYDLCDHYDIEYLNDECILMFVEPLGFIHKLHRGINKVFKKYPI